MTRKRRLKSSENLKFLLHIVGSSAILLAVAMLLVHQLGNSRLVLGVFYGYVVSLINIVFAFYSIKWALDKSNTICYMVTFGGMGFRFAVLLGALIFVWKLTQIPLLAFAISMAAFYLTLQIFEIRFIQRELKLRKAVS